MVKANRIIDSDEEMEVVMEKPEQLQTEQIDPDQFFGDVQSEDSDGNHYDLENQKSQTIHPSKPTKKDRLESRAVAQRALRELQFELPQRQSKMNFSSFLEKKGVKRFISLIRDTALEELHRVLRPKHLQKESQNEEIQVEGTEEMMNEEDVVVDQVEEEPMPKTEHLIPLTREYDSDSDIDIEIITKKPKIVVVENRIGNQIRSFKQNLLQLAAEQKEKRRIQELEERKREVEEMKRKRQERREARKLEEEQRRALELENANLEKSNNIEGNDEDLEDAGKATDTVPNEMVQDVQDGKTTPITEETQQEESHIHLEYESESDKSLELDSGSDIDSSALPVQKEANDFQISLGDEEFPENSSCSVPREPISLSISQPELSLSTPLFDELGQDCLAKPMLPKDSSEQATQSEVLEYLSGSFPETQKLGEEVSDSKSNEIHFELEDEVEEGDIKSTENQLELEDKVDIVPTKVSPIISPKEIKDRDSSIPNEETENIEDASEVLEKSEDELDCSQEDSPPDSPKEITIQDILDLDSNDEDEVVDEKEEDLKLEKEENKGLFVKWSVVENINTKLQKTGPKFVETEAEVEEDEFMNFGGADGEDTNGKDEYDKSMLADSDDEVGDKKAVLELHRQQLADEDKKVVDAIINDVTSGAYRKRKSLREGALGLDLYDSDEETEAILKRIRQRMGINYNSKTGEVTYDPNSLDSLASNPKTKAFAEVFQVKEEVKVGFLSSSDDESKIATFNPKVRTSKAKRKVYRSTSQSDYSESQSEISQVIPQISIPENIASSIVEQIKSRNSVQKPILQKAASTSNLLMKSSTRLLSKKSILESIDEVVIEEQSHGQGPSKSASTFKMRSVSLQESKSISISEAEPEPRKKSKSKPKPGLVQLFHRNESFR